MRHNRPRDHSGVRLSKSVRDSLESGFVRKAGDGIRTFITENPLLSTCLGLAAGFVIGKRLRR
jgi:hypothetical protein